MNKHRILFLAANPVGLPERRLDEQARRIQEELRLSNERDQFEFIPCLAARPMDLLRALREFRPSIVHFCGHPGIDGIYLVGEDRQPAPVTREALQATFGAAGRSVQIIVLGGCAIDGVGQALGDLVPVCVGTPVWTGDDATSAFSVGFYGALASNEPVARARLHGEAAMKLEVSSEHVRACLYHRGDVDPETFILTGVIAKVADLDELDRSTLQKYITQYTQALKAEPAHRDALLALGICYLKLGLFELADRFLRQLIDAHPADPSGYYYRAICILKGKRPRIASLPVIREAEQLIDTALALDLADGRYDVLLAAVRHDYYVLNGMRVPAPGPEDLMASAQVKHVDRREVEQMLGLIKLNEGPVRRRFLS